MKHHGAYLSRFLKSEELSIRQFALSFEQHSSHINRVVNGIDSLSRANLVKIIELLLDKPSRANLKSDSTARAFARSLIVHWLRDQVPEGWENEIRILADEWSNVPELDSSIDPRADAIAFFDEASKTNDQIADWLISSKAVMKHPQETEKRLEQAASYRSKGVTIHKNLPDQTPGTGTTPLRQAAQEHEED